MRRRGIGGHASAAAAVVDLPAFTEVPTATMSYVCNLHSVPCTSPGLATDVCARETKLKLTT